MKTTACNSFIALGTVFLILGLTGSRTAFTAIGLAFLATGVAARRKKKDPAQD